MRDECLLEKKGGEGEKTSEKSKKEYRNREWEEEERKKIRDKIEKRGDRHQDKDRKRGGRYIKKDRERKTDIESLCIWCCLYKIYWIIL